MKVNAIILREPHEVSGLVSNTSHQTNTCKVVSALYNKYKQGAWWALQKGPLIQTWSQVRLPRRGMFRLTLVREENKKVH